MTHEAETETAFELHQAALAHAMECFKILRLDPDVEAYRALERTIQAYLSASGMVLMPREATEEMVDAGSDVEGSWDVARKTWEIMLAAAPDPFKSKL